MPPLPPGTYEFIVWLHGILATAMSKVPFPPPGLHG